MVYESVLVLYQLKLKTLNDVRFYTCNAWSRLLVAASNGEILMLGGEWWLLARYLSVCTVFTRSTQNARVIYIIFFPRSAPNRLLSTARARRKLR